MPMTIHVLGPTVPYDSNTYLIKADENILIDTGTGMGSGPLVSRIRNLVGDQGLDRVILTHCHVDHIGGLKDIVKEFHCGVFASEMDSRIISAADSTFTLDTHFGISLEPVPTDVIGDGDIISLGEHNLRCIYTPGHTRGGLCLLDEVTGSLFSGDTLFADSIGRTDFPSGSGQDLLESLISLRSLEFSDLYPGHGSIVRGDAKKSLEYGIKMAEFYS